MVSTTGIYSATLRLPEKHCPTQSMSDGEKLRSYPLNSKWHINLQNQVCLFRDTCYLTLIIKMVISSLENQEKVWDPIMNLEKLL